MKNTSKKPNNINLLFIGDIFGLPGIEIVEKKLNLLKTQYKIDFVVAQSENVSDRKGLTFKDYKRLKKSGIDVFTMGNHVWAKKEINRFVDNFDIVRPANIDKKYPGKGSRVFKVKNCTVRVTNLMGITFNKLLPPWNEDFALNFFDEIDEVLKKEKTDYHIIDFHAETTSEKNVLGIYLDGKVDAVLGTHTHVQTNDAKVLEKGTYYLTDVGMTGPKNAAIGAKFSEVYQKMRFNSLKKFKVSENPAQFNAVLIKLTKSKSKKIKLINF